MRNAGRDSFPVPDFNQVIQINAGFQSYRAQGIRTEEVVCVDRNNHRVDFLAPELIEASLSKCLANLNEDMSDPQDMKRVLFGLSRFWISFIAIHPFSDANGRTGKKIISNLLTHWRGRRFDLSELDKILLGPDFQENLKNLYQGLQKIIQENHT